MEVVDFLAGEVLDDEFPDDEVEVDFDEESEDFSEGFVDVDVLSELLELEPLSPDPVALFSEERESVR